LKGVVRTKVHATDAQIRSGKPGTLVRNAKSGQFVGTKAGGKPTTKTSDKAPPKTRDTRHS
jgi:hypothetical protein